MPSHPLSDEPLELSAGLVLTAAHNLLDTHFKRAVVFLAQHEHKGTLGYILNRPLEQTLQDILPDVQSFNAPLYWGGPCQNDTLHCVHRLGSHIPGALEIAEGVYWGGQFDFIADLLVSGGAEIHDIRFFVGYAGWSDGQLADEMKEKSWMPISSVQIHHTPLSLQTLIFEEPHKNLWMRLVAGMGGNYRMIASTPEHPSLN